MSKDDAPTKKCFYALKTRGSKPQEGDDDEYNFLYFFSVTISFYVGEYG